jgi:SAM-dependent methyltransferase
MAAYRINLSFTGVGRIIRFNWHFYVLAAALLLASVLLGAMLPAWWRPYCRGLVVLVAAQILLSLIVSWWVYDVSSLYRFTWLQRWQLQPLQMINIHAGYDDTSERLNRLFPQARLQVFDFYNPQLHTEVSIRRARRWYPAYPGTISISTSYLPVPAAGTDVVWLLLSAHEIRQPAERERFFCQLKQALAPGGCVVLVEHLRDLPNFVAFNFGCFHFHSRSSWQQCWQTAGFQLVDEFSITPFVRCFKLQ